MNRRDLLKFLAASALPIDVRAARFLRGSRSGGGGAADPFTWYPTLDKALLPFHAGAGDWGPQSTIKEPAGPTTTSTGTAGTLAQLQDAVATPGTQVTLTDDIGPGSYTSGDITDVDLIIPTGALLNNPSFGAGNVVTRFRIRGSTVGSYSGGQMHVCNMNFNVTGSDFIVDGVGCTGTEDFGALNIGAAAGFSRGAVVNCRIASGGFGIGSTISDLTVAGCSILTGLVWPWTTNDEAYGIRFYNESLGNLVAAYNDIRSNPGRGGASHARVRCHPNTGLDYVAVMWNYFVERVELHLFLCDAAAGGGTGKARCVWWNENESITTHTSSDAGADVPKIYGNTGDGYDTDRAYIQNNDFASNGFLDDSDIALTGELATTKSGNSYTTTIPSDPAWGAAGDPSGLNIAP